MTGREAVPIKTVFNTGASAHVVGSKKEIDSLMQSVQRRVVLDHSRPVISDASWSTTNYCTAKGRKPAPFFDVLFVPCLDTNLLSCSEMENQRYKISFKEGKCFLIPPGEQHPFVIGG